MTTELKPGVPDFNKAFIRHMLDLQISVEQVSEFLTLWRHLPPHPPTLPCPMCFTKKSQGRLIALPEEDGVERVRCQDCGATIIVHEGV
jgi:hypothetical protein